LRGNSALRNLQLVTRPLYFCTYSVLCNRLLEANITVADDDSTGFSDDEYFTTKIVNAGPSRLILVTGAVSTAILGALLGFVIAMRNSKGFNRRVRSNSLFIPLAKSRNSLIRSSLRLDDLDYEEIYDYNDVGRETSVPTF
jgi:hypothetical protein